MFTVSLSFDCCPKAAVAPASRARVMRQRRRIGGFLLVRLKNAGEAQAIPVNSLFQCCGAEAGPTVTGGRACAPPAPPASALEHAVAQNPGDLRDHLVGVLPEVGLDAEDDLDREVVVEDARSQ